MLITRVWKNQPGEYFCISTKSRAGQWKDHFFKRTELKKVKQFIEDNLDKDLYWCPHGFSQARRLKDYAEMPNLLWADLDEADPSKIKPMPSIAWCSSPGRFVGLWLVDQEVTEDLNRRLTYAVGADQGGWDVTQVLRVPGTQNYKYPNSPRVRMLWQDGPHYTIDEILTILPAVKDATPNHGAAMKIYRRYEKRLKPWARKQLFGGKPTKGKRSEVIWRLNKEMLEAGMTMDEAFMLLWVTPWNKFAGRRNGEAQLRRELEKSVQQKLESAPVEAREQTEEDEPPRFSFTPISEVEQENLSWLWYPYLARGELTILEGDPGLGKSYLIQMVGAHIADGKRLPSLKAQKPVTGNVLYFDLENSAGSVTKTRLICNGCNHLERYIQEQVPFMMDDEDALDAIYEGLEKVRPVLVVFDTLNTYIGKADVYKGHEAQQALVTFVEMAKRFNCSVVVLRHLTKSTKEKALYRGQGNIAQAGMARVVMTVGQHPEEPDVRVMAVTKLNVTRIPKALTFTITALPDTLKMQDRSKFEWGDWVEFTADEIVVAAPAKKERTEEVSEFLVDLLGPGPMSVAGVQRAATAKGISMKALRRHADELGVIRKLSGKGTKRTSTWALRGSTNNNHAE